MFYTPELIQSIDTSPLSDFMCKIAVHPDHPEHVTAFDNWTAIVQPQEVRKRVGHTAAGMLVVNPYITDERHIVNETELPDAARIELFDILMPAAEKLVEHRQQTVDEDLGNLLGFVQGFHSEGTDSVINPATGRSVEHFHLQVLPVTEGDIIGGILQAYTSLANLRGFRAVDRSSRKRFDDLVDRYRPQF